MKIQHYTETAAQPVEGAPGVTIRWVISKDDHAPNFAMRVFEVQPGSASPYHTHPWEHEVFILEGRGALKTTGEERPFEKDYVVYVAPNEEHQFVNQGDSVLRFICVIPIVEG